MNYSTESIEVQDDGLYTPEIRPHSVEKYKQLHMYNRIMTTGMRKHWDNLVYIDLYSAAGISKIEGQNKYYMGSPYLALNVEHQFDKYIFCDENPDCIYALRERICRDYPHVNASYVIGNCNDKIDEIISHMPRYSKDKKMLSLCLLDPFDFSIKFETIRKLSRFIIDYILLLAVGMELKRFRQSRKDYMYPKIDGFLGNSDWRENIPDLDILDNDKFAYFILRKFTEQMYTIGYPDTALKELKEIKLHEKNRVLYYLAYFTKKDIGYTYWKQSKNYASPQLTLFK